MQTTLKILFMTKDHDLINRLKSCYIQEVDEEEDVVHFMADVIWRNDGVGFVTIHTSTNHIKQLTQEMVLNSHKHGFGHYPLVVSFQYALAYQKNKHEELMELSRSMTGH